MIFFLFSFFSNRLTISRGFIPISTVGDKCAKDIFFGGGGILLQESHAVARKPRDAAAVLFGLKFADIFTKFKSSQASNARLQSSKHSGAKQNLTQNGHSRSFKVTCFGVSGKATIRD